MKLNICEQEIINNVQQSAKRKLYRIENTVGIMDIGNFRKHQEDSILISKHQEISNIELFLIADGMGGLENGAKASHIAAYEMFKWFNNMSKKEFMQNSFLINSLKSQAFKIDDKIRKECGSGGTTMVSALALFDSILIINIGDSRAYSFNGRLNQITTDHSISQKLFDKGVIKQKDDMRFHKKNNLILSRLGCEKRLLDIDFYELSKDEVDYLLLFSDGITDLISNTRLEDIIINSRDIENTIISEALMQDSYSENLNLENYYEKLDAGRDNASLILKRRKKWGKYKKNGEKV